MKAVIQYELSIIRNTVNNKCRTSQFIYVERYTYDPNGTRNYEMNTHRGITGRNLTYSDEDIIFWKPGTPHIFTTWMVFWRRNQAHQETLSALILPGENF